MSRQRSGGGGQGGTASVREEELRRLYKTLVKRAKTVATYERATERARERRNEIVYELLDIGASERAIARAAGISGPAVHLIKETRVRTRE
jgi:hypothetical protein